MTTDNDAPGRRAAERDFAMLALYFRTLLTPDLPDGSDPADVLRSYGPGGLRAALRHTVPTVRRTIELRVGLWERWFDHLAGQLNAVTAVADLVRQLPPRDVAAEIAWLADRVGLPSDIVTRTVVDAATAERHFSGRNVPAGRSAEHASSRELGL